MWPVAQSWSDSIVGRSGSAGWPGLGLFSDAVYALYVLSLQMISWLTCLGRWVQEETRAVVVVVVVKNAMVDCCMLYVCMYSKYLGIAEFCYRFDGGA